ncbi:PREDICTED: heme oxygenase 1 isoform X2 [Eurypyga helias]|uniref:heme oxygenase 1 isoform X2 n=1 Tax=Eurypyga helias TaxID=54383 RepID=UPI0005292EDA|nr:PREDICTED: heme oxygenase 1 isoform X2 [Eurypyga helias]
METSQTHGSEGMSRDLSELMKEATKEVHERAENTPFMKNFQKGQVSLQEFKMVTASLYFIYSALEEEIERNKNKPVYAPVYFPAELHRKAALEKDLEYFYGSNWRKDIPCPEATQKYVERLHYVGKSHPELLVAHAYTRYLGDLSGGQVLKKIAQKALQLPSTGEGLAFFTFDGVSNATKFKQLYRSRMNALEMDLATKKRVLEEGKKFFIFRCLRRCRSWCLRARRMASLCSRRQSFAQGALTNHLKTVQLLGKKAKGQTGGRQASFPPLPWCGGSWRSAS